MLPGQAKDFCASFDPGNALFLGLFTYDNVLYPHGNPLLDVGGLLFTDTVTGAEMNIWGNGFYPPSFYSTYTAAIRSKTMPPYSRSVRFPSRQPGPCWQWA